MKKFLLIAVIMIFSTSLKSQIEQGAIALMGGIHVVNNLQQQQLGSSGTFYDRNNVTNLDFGGMYFLMPRLALGAALLVSNSASLTGQDNTDNLKLVSSSSLAGGRLFGRYYFPCLAPRFYTYGQVGFDFQGGSSKSYDDDGNEESKDNVSRIGAGLNTGFSYFLIPAIALEMNFGLFNWAQTTTTNSEASDIKRINNSFELLALSKTLTFGFCWYLGRSGQGFNAK